MAVKNGRTSSIVKNDSPRRDCRPVRPVLQTRLPFERRKIRKLKRENTLYGRKYEQINKRTRQISHMQTHTVSGVTGRGVEDINPLPMAYIYTHVLNLTNVL